MKSQSSQQIYTEIDDFVEFLPDINYLESVKFDQEFHHRLARIDSLSQINRDERAAAMKYFFEATSHELEKSCAQERSRRKPLGYAGDFLLMDWIYTEKTGCTAEEILWDRFFYRMAAPVAARNRKRYFCDLYTRMCSQSSNGISVLNLASGPGRDMSEAIDIAGEKAHNSFFHCVDVEPEAIGYAREMTAPQSWGISFQWEVANIFKFIPPREYELIWAGGLFDYIKDDPAIAIIKNLWQATKPNGKLVLGNFHPRNPSRLAMEWGAEWYLIHRSESELRNIFEQANIPKKLISIDQEPSGACIFGIAENQS